MFFSLKFLFVFVILFSRTDASDPTEDFQSKIGLAFPEIVNDLACLASTFPSGFAKEQDKTNYCFTHVFERYEEIRDIPSMFYDQTDQSFIANVYPLIGIKGLHLKVIERKKIHSDEKQFVFILIRHQEYDSYLTDEMNEMMSLFGPAATVDRRQGNKEMFGASVMASFIRFVRQKFGLDHFPQALTMFNQIRSFYENRTDVQFIFSGFSSGGLFSILLALYHHQPAITLAATGVEDISRLYYSSLFPDKSTVDLPAIYNFAHLNDFVPQLDCQIGRLCLYQSMNDEEKKTSEEIHLSTVYDQSEPALIRWMNDDQRWFCTSADRFNELYGSCQRERLRWKDRMTKKATTNTDL